MYTTYLRKVGGSVMLAVPPSILDQFQLKAGAQVGLAIEGERLILEPRPRPKYTLEELLARCDHSIPLERTEEELEWLNSAPVGRELL